jgi:hypothetical protein
MGVYERLVFLECEFWILLVGEGWLLEWELFLLLLFESIKKVSEEEVFKKKGCV